MAKNLFSTQAETYFKYRPSYPKELYEYILQFVEEKNIAWDCATGNGQAALVLADHFKKVIATDISEKQLAFAKQHKNIEYKISLAEQTDFANDNFDLITVAQAYHWFQFEQFEKEVKRVAKNNAVIAVWGYGLMSTTDPSINALIKKFYSEITGPYWDNERKYVDDSYRNIPFNFAPLPTEDFVIRAKWNKEDLTGYFNSWSSVQHYIKAKNQNPVNLITDEIDQCWNSEIRDISFPLFLRIGRIKK